MRDKVVDYVKLMRLNKPVGIWLLLWPTLWGLWFASQGVPPLKVLVIFVIGTVLMRSAGCVINDYADRHVDPQVARTKDRPVAAGRVAPDEAVRLFVVLCLVAFAGVTQLDPRTVMLSLPAVALAASYPFAKRFHSMPQAHLGLAFSWGIPMAFSALQRPVPWLLCGLLIAANLLWAIAYDTFYAMTDREDDRRAGVKSSALLFGTADRGITAALQLGTLLLLAGAGLVDHRGAAFFGGLAIAAGFAGYQQWLIRARDPQACFRAFLNNAWFGAAVFAGLALDLAGA